MNPRARFWLLYSACLGACVGGIEGAKAWAARAPEAAEPQDVAGFIAIPPKPEGADQPEGDGEGVRYSEEICERYTGDPRDACFHALAMQRAERDPEGALDACELLADGELLWECHSDVAELHSRVDRAWSEALCPTIPRKKWRDQCWFGIALAWSVHDYEYARDTCLKSGMWTDFCRHDVNGEIAQVDPEAALAWCELERGDLLRRKTCFHGLGKYLGRVDPPLAVDICDRVPAHEPLYRENCFHGLGWAVAETRGEDTLSFCVAEAGDYHDSCVLGVSAHAKRLDPSRAFEICGLAKRSDLRERCEAFARR